MPASAPAQDRRARRLDRIANNLLLLSAAARALRALDNAGVATLVLKGASLIDTVFAIDERAMADVDLLVRARDLRSAEHALSTTGAARVRDTGRPWSSKVHYAGAYRLPEGVDVDIHTSLAVALRWRIPIEDLFARSVPMRLNAACSARRLCNEDLLLYVAINQASDDYASDARPAMDVARVVETLAVDWDSLVERARSWRCSAATWLTLEHGRRHAGAPVPLDVIRALRPSRLRSAYLQRLLALDAATPYRFPRHDRRLRQLLIGPAATDAPWRFVAAGLRFVALRSVDAAWTAARPGRRQRAIP